jgi:hypothetical protein
MSQNANNARPTSALAGLDADQKFSSRILKLMVLATSLGVLGSALLAPWRFTTGLLIGGLLALINHHWLHSSTTAAFRVLVDGQKPRLAIGTYALRYLVIAATVFGAYQLGIASLPAMLVGLCSFVAAIFIEALREFYFAIIQREEIS